MNNSATSTHIDSLVLKLDYSKEGQTKVIEAALLKMSNNSRRKGLWAVVYTSH